MISSIGKGYKGIKKGLASKNGSQSEGVTAIGFKPITA